MQNKERKAFQFLISFYDVFEKLEKDKDKVQFITALIEKQLFDRDPKDLTMMADFAYTSQRERISASVNGFKTANQCSILDPLLGGNDTPPQGSPIGPPIGPLPGGHQTPPDHNIIDNNIIDNNKEDNKKDTFNHKSFLIWFNNTRDEFYKTGSSFQVLTSTDRNNLKALVKTYDQDDFLKAFKAMIRNEWVIQNEMVTPAHFLRGENFQKYLNSYGTRQEQTKRMQGR